MTNFFLDTGYVVALAIKRDQYHGRAVELLERVEREQARLVTTRLVVAEIGDALAAPKYREKAAEHIAMLEQDPTVEIIPLTDTLFQRGFDLYKERQDKSWSITDCISFVVMGDREIQDALSTDSDFSQAGFNALLQN